MNLFRPDTSFTTDYYKIGQYKLAWRLCLVFIVAFILLAAMLAQVDIIGFSIYLTTLGLSIFAFILLYKTKNSLPIFWIFAIGGTAIVIFSMNSVQYILHYSDLMWTVNIILFAFIGLKNRWVLMFIGIHTLNIIYYVSFSLVRNLELVHSRQTFAVYSDGIELLFAFLIMTYLVFQNIRFQNFSQKELLRMNALLEVQNKENITLLKEVHHRVKNNLQIVVSLLRIQSSEIQSDETKKQFDDAINRVMTISMIHKKLYQLGELSELQFKEYIEGLVEDISNLHIGNQDVSISVDTQLDTIDMQATVPIGLIINELITNSLKHAFGDNKKGEIAIQFIELEGKEVLLKYSDSGKWKENKKDGFGAELLYLLTDQLEGKLTRVDSTLSFRFPVIEA